MRVCVLAITCLLSAPVWAADTLTAEEFETYTTGKTLFFGRAGQAYGAEKYLPNRRVRWSFLDGDCKDGRWYTQGPQICFEYEDSIGTQCWLFRKGSNGLIAEFQSDEPGPDLYEAQDLGQEMVCLGPEVGV